jgi:Xaa-Pro aminopeptidase
MLTHPAESRLSKLRSTLAASDIPAILITDLLNVRYLSGFSGTFAILLITPDAALIFTDSRYTEQASLESPSFNIRKVGSKWLGDVAEAVTGSRIRRLAFEGETVRYSDWKGLAEALPDIELMSTEGLVEELRLVKDEYEIDLLREAIHITELACIRVLTMLRPGMTEKEVAFEIVTSMLKNGADKEGFDTIVASGPRSAMPHATPTDRQISSGEFVVMDFGAYYQGYHGDITRTVVLGPASDKQKDIVNTVLAAQASALDAVRPGIAGAEIDAVARDYIAAHGYGDYFGHGLGHGLGLDIHDGRILAPNSEIVLQAGMVVTVEPGIYLPGYGGVRIEDDILVTDTGCEVLTSHCRQIAP